MGMVRGTSSGSAAAATAAAAAASPSTARDSVKSEAFAAFMAAKKAASSGGVSGLPSTTAAAAQHTRSLIPNLSAAAAFPLGTVRVSSGGSGQTVPAGGSSSSPFPSLPAVSPSGSPAPSSAGVPLYSPLASAPAAILATPTAAAATVTAPVQPLQSSEAVPQRATRRLALDAFLTLSLQDLEPRHAHASQYHFLRGLHALRRADWIQAESSLRRAQDLYATTIEQGSLLHRIEKQDSKDEQALATKAAAAASASTAPSRQASQSMPTDPFPPASSANDDIELTQPLSQPAAAGAAFEANARSAEDAPTPDLPPPRTAFVARKAADIKCCLAIAIWKRAFAEAEAAAASGIAPPADHSAEPPLAEAKRLFIESLTLEDGARLSTWNAFCLYLFAAEDASLAKQTLSHVIAEYQSRAQRRGSILESRGIDPQQDEASFDAGTGIDDLQVNLALMQLLDPSGGESSEALLNTQDVLLHSALQSAHHLPALNNYALMLLRQDRASDAREHLELLLRHDPGDARYWNNLAVCIELMSSTRCDPLPPLSPSEAAQEEALAASASSLLLPLGVFPRPAASLAATAKDEALSREVKYCLEKAAFYEATSDGAAEAASWPFRCNLATHLLSAARAEPHAATRDQHYAACEAVLLSIPPSGSKKQENYAHVYSLLGSLYSARSISAEQDGLSASALQFKSASLAAFARSLEIDSSSTSTWNNLGVLHLTAGEVQQVNPYWIRIIRAIKSGAGVGVGEESKVDEKKSVAATAATKDEYPECSASDLAALRARLSPAHLRSLAALLCNLAISLQLSSRLPESERAYRDSIALVPDQAPVWMGLGNLLRQRSDLPGAIKAFGRALDLRPDYALAYSNLSLAHIQQSDWLAAYYCLERAHSLGPHLLSVRSNRLKLSLLLTRMGFSLPLPPAAVDFDPLASTPGLGMVFSTTTATATPMMALPALPALPMPMPLPMPLPLATATGVSGASVSTATAASPSVGFVPNAATADLLAQYQQQLATKTAGTKQTPPSRKRGHSDDEAEAEEESSGSSTDPDDDGEMED